MSDHYIKKAGKKLFTVNGVDEIQLHDGTKFRMSPDTDLDLNPKLYSEELDKLKEKLAAIEHQRWADWQKWVHSVCTKDEHGDLIIPPGLVKRWNRQIIIPYSELSDKEKASDMEQVDRYWPLILSKVKAAVLEGQTDILKKLLDHNKLQRVETAVPKLLKELEQSRGRDA